MAYNFKYLSDVDSIETPSDEINIIIEEHGDIKKIQKKLLGTNEVPKESLVEEIEKYLTENPPECSITVDSILSDTSENPVQNKVLAKKIETISLRSTEAINKVSQLSGQINDLKDNGVVGSSIEPREDDIPKVFFSEAIPKTKDDVVTGFRYISKTKDVSGFAEFKAQGNSSMSYPKKNMTVKMYKDEALEEKLKVDFKNWGEQRKHVYKANWIDLTHARNVVSARLWADVVKSRADYELLPELLRTSPNQGAVDGFPVKVYSQGIYQGRYTLNIPKDAWMANMDDSLDEHCILCGEGYNSGCFRSASMGEWTDEVHDSRPTLITNRWLEIINFVMNSTDEEFKANLGNYFFVDSLIDYFIFGMISCGLDAFGKNQLYMTYDGIKWIAVMYDMDSTWGLYWNGSKFVSASYSRTEFEDFVNGRQGNLLYIRLANLFYEEIQYRYEELKHGALSIPNIINHFERFIDIAPLDLVEEDYASTTGSGKFTGIPSKTTNNIQQIRKFVIDRYVYCDEYFASLTPEVQVPCTGITLDKTILTFTDSTTQTITATVEPENTTDIIVWTSNNEEVAKVSNGVVTPIRKGSCTITATAGSVSVTCEVTVDIEEIVTYTITRNLTNCTSSSAVISINEGSAHTETITPNSGYTLDGATVTITMGETDISSSFVDGVLTIASVTGDIVVAVSAVEVVEEPVLLYSLPESTTFNGTSDYIDTGITLFDTNKDFSVLLDFECVGNNTSQATVFHSMLESSPYPGVGLDFKTTNNTGLRMTVKNPITIYPDENIATSTDKFKVVITKNSLTNEISCYCDKIDEPKVWKSSLVATAFEQTALLGAYQTPDGTKGRFWSGTIHDCKIYEGVLSDYAITEFIETPIYSLPEPTTFNGTSDYVDTGIKLFDEPKDFTILADVTIDTSVYNGNLATIMHCLNEISPYPGLCLQKNGADHNTDYMFGGRTSGGTSFANSKNTLSKFVVICEDGAISKIYVKNDTGINSTTCNDTYESFDKNLILGAYQDNHGNFGRYWKGTINEFKVYDSVLSDAEINAYLTA